jgi:hypothetical protein
MGWYTDTSTVRFSQFSNPSGREVKPYELKPTPPTAVLPDGTQVSFGSYTFKMWFINQGFRVPTLDEFTPIDTTNQKKSWKCGHQQLVELTDPTSVK